MRRCVQLRSGDPIAREDVVPLSVEVPGVSPTAGEEEPEEPVDTVAPTRSDVAAQAVRPTVGGAEDGAIEDSDDDTYYTPYVVAHVFNPEQPMHVDDAVGASDNDSVGVEYQDGQSVGSQSGEDRASPQADVAEDAGQQP